MIDQGLTGQGLALGVGGPAFRRAQRSRYSTHGKNPVFDLGRLLLRHGPGYGLDRGIVIRAGQKRCQPEGSEQGGRCQG